MKKFIKLPDSELEIMLIIWDIGGSVNTSQIMEAMNNKKSVQVVQTYLRRLENKGFINTEKLGRLNYYKPVVFKEDYRKQETNQFVNRFYGNSSNLFASLLKNNQMSAKELKEIRQMIEESGD